MQTFKQSVALFCSLRQPYLAVSTVASYRLALDTFARVIGDRDITSYTAVNVLEFVQSQVEGNRKPNGINVDLRVLRALGHWLAEQEMLPDRNPFAQLKLLKVRHQDIRFLTSVEFNRIYLAETSPLMRNIYLVALTCGQRLSDVVSLRWEQIDFQRNIIRFIQKKSNRRNSVPLHSMLVEVLQQIGIEHEGPVFKSRIKKELTPAYVSHRFTRAAQHAGINDVTFHTLRRSFASWLAQEGVPIQQISKLLGHASVVLTEKYYASLAQSDLTPAVMRIHPATGSIQQLTAGPEPDTRFQVQHKVVKLKV